MILTKNFTLFLAFVLFSIVYCDTDWSEDINPQKWIKYSQDRIQQMLKRKINGNVAKNSIFFLGDGMGVATVTAGRIWKGQLQNKNGEEEITHMESLDHLALSKVFKKVNYLKNTLFFKIFLRLTILMHKHLIVPVLPLHMNVELRLEFELLV